MSENSTSQATQYLNVAQTAKYLNISKKFVYDSVEKGNLKHSRLANKLIRIKKSDADAFMQAFEMGGDASDN